VISQKLLSLTLLGAGWVLWLLIGLSVLSVAVALERAVYFYKRRMISLDPPVLRGARFPKLMELCQAGQLSAAARLASGESMEAEVVRAADGAAASGREAVAMTTAACVERKRIEYEQRLSILGTLGNNAPFIGLFGTVLGIIRAFADLSIAGKGGAQAVMGGISEALVATAVGLFVAIPAVLSFNFFQRLVRRSVGRANALRSAIAAGLSRAQPTNLSESEES
jgi:biopolymer transport protein ExbB